MKNLKKKIVLTSTVFFTFIYLLWRIFFTIPFEYGVIHAIFGIILLGAELIGFGELAIHFKMMMKVARPKLPKVEPDKYPTVDVFVATYNEPVEILYKTLNGCINMEYPDKNKVQIYLCDDGNRAEMAELAKSFGVNYLTREKNIGAKGGNLNNAMKNSKGELIVTLDADMIPKHDFLEKTVPYFCVGEKIGFVQAPQDFYNMDMYQHNLYADKLVPNEMDLFYHTVELSKNSNNSVIYGGSNTVLLRKALEEVGGFVTDVITEDFATGMLIQEKGYTCYAVNDIVASGLSPQDFPNLIRQRRRWASGCIQTGKKYKALKRKGLTWSQRLAYYTSVLYWYDNIKRMIYLVNPLLMLVGIASVKGSLKGMLMFWLPTYLLNNIALGIMTDGRRSVMWSGIYETAMAPFLFPTVVGEMLGVKQTIFAVTEKKKKSTVIGGGLSMAKPHIIFAALYALGLITSIIIGIVIKEVTILFQILWYVVNLYNLTMAILAIKGRSTRREDERFALEVDTKVIYGDTCIETKTIDMGEGGCAMLVSNIQKLQADTPAMLEFSEGRYKASVKASVSYIENAAGAGRVGFVFDKVQEECDRRNLLHIIYDRILPKTVAVDTSVGRLRLLWVNIRNRVSKNYKVN